MVESLPEQYIASKSTDQYISTAVNKRSLLETHKYTYVKNDNFVKLTFSTCTMIIGIVVEI